MAVTRFQIASNKKTALMKQQMREIAKLLAEEPTPKEEKARIRAEALIREDNCVEAYEILQLECDLLSERIKLISAEKKCPSDLVSIVSTLMWAADRVDIPELGEIKKQFRSKYGKQFEEDAMNNKGGVLNERVVAKLSVQPPSAYLVQTYLEKIADEFGVDYKPKERLTAEQAVEPMAPPNGYSVLVGGGTGLGPAAVTGQAAMENDVNYMSKDVPPPMAPAVATPYTPDTPPVPPPNGDNFDEPDIFIPTNPTGPPAGGKGSGGDNDDNGGDQASADASYNDLAARFAQLKK